VGTWNVIPVTTADYRRLAARRLPRFLFDYIDGGSGEEISMGRNVADLQKIRLEQRVMRDVAEVTTQARILGEPVAMPLALAPVGLTGMFRRRGEAQAARAARKAGIPFATSTVGVCPVDEVAKAAGAPPWFQLYMLKDRSIVHAMLDRAEQAGCTTLVFTVDLPLTGKRYRDDRNGMLGAGFKGKVAKALQLATRPAWLWDVGIRGKPHDLGNLRGVVPGLEDLETFKVFIDSQFDPSVTWFDIEQISKRWQGKLLVKGVMSADDAVSAVNSGADGVVISNHGGRQIDGVASTVSRLPGIVDAVGSQAEVLLDSGVRNGSDIVKAVALGATAVMMGRPWVYALAARGEQGVADLLRVFQLEMANTMALMGVNSLQELTPDLVETRGVCK
jgi:L-lactate dehydrogenase (cytochrome)